MLVTQQTVTSFADEAKVLLRIAANLGSYRRQDQWEEFERSLLALGLDARDVKRHWDTIDVCAHSPSPNGNVDIDWSRIKSNTDLSSHLGILLKSDLCPRNELLYRLMEHHFPDFFEVEVKGKVHMGGEKSRGNPAERRLVLFPKQPNGRTRNGTIGVMSVHEVLSGKEPSQFSARVMRAAKPMCAALGDKLGVEMTELFLNLKMGIPSRLMAKQLARVVQNGLRGEPVTIVGAFCPDYAYEQTGDPHVPYRYTFDGLGNGVGLVAQQFVRIVPQFSAFLKKMGISHNMVLGIGDFEADSSAVLKRVGLSRQDFLDRCRTSLKRFSAEVPKDLPLELEMFDEDRGQGRLRQYAGIALTEMLAGQFGRMAEIHQDLNKVLARIPGQYRTFYERWYKRPMTDMEVNEIVYSQGSEYAAVARIFEEDFGSNIIMLAGDRPEMHRFNAFFSLYPTLCAKRAY